jgi:solute:Na+ symporter, SSS family
MTNEALGSNADYFVMIAYFMVIVGFGVYFGKYASSTKDFFFGGQRFSWWLIAFSSIATMVGSYSFIKYSNMGFQYGLSSTQSYLNDWFWMPILMLVWLPIVFFQRIQSVPEYFERRFGTPARLASTVFIMLYLVGYVGINLFTLGRALEPVLGWSIFTGAAVSCVLVTVYVFAGGQTSVIMTDLVQGVILLAVGLGLFFTGVAHVGGFINFWELLPTGHRYIFSDFNKPDSFSFIGIYAQDGLANTGAFMLMNQGMMMRFLSLRSVKDARKMAVCWVLVLGPIAAITVSGGGWVARALFENGELETDGGEAFVRAAAFLCSPGVFGFVLAALLAALMSTADTLINAASAIFVNDIYRPYLVKGRQDKHYLTTARLSSLSVALLGLLLVPVFENSGSIYAAHGKFTAAITPPIVVAIFLGIFWRRFNAKAALITLIGGGVMVGLSFLSPLDDLLLKPFSFGMGPDSYKFTRALFGLVSSGVLGAIMAAATKPQSAEQLKGLINGTQLDAMRVYKGGGEINLEEGKNAHANLQEDTDIEDAEAALIPQSALDTMAANIGDMIYVCDRRWWFGGLRSVHARVAGLSPDDDVHLSSPAMASAHFKEDAQIYVEKIC